MRRSLCLLLALAACQSKSDSLDGDKPFLAVYQEAQTNEAKSDAGTSFIKGTGSNTAFYVAIKKTEMGNKFFLSAYLKDLFPGAVSYGAARSLGMRVVSFKEQNGKVFVFDVDDRKKTSDTFDPQLVLDAWPIVHDAKFESQNGANKYLLVDVAAGLNRYSVMGDYYGGAGYRFNVEVAYMQRFRDIQDGATFEQVFTGYSDYVDPSSPSAMEDNLIRASGTLGWALRRYTEGQGFAPREMPDQELFFRSPAQIVPNAGYAVQYADHWNIKKGMKPIEWAISDHIKQYALDPRFKNVDIFGAMQRGVTNWNEAFGFTALTARMAESDETFSDDDLNYIIFDEDPSNGYAFANWRENPNTGEIRGASVYFNAMWLEIAYDMFLKDAGEAPTPAGREAAAAPAAKAAKHPTLSWDAMPSTPLCMLAVPTKLDADTASVRSKQSATRDNPNMTAEQKFENYITHVLTHEVGHTLGLRHNFKGSLVPTSSSVMEYIIDEDAIYHAHPGSYDKDALKYLYLGSDATPSDPFCTDDSVGYDPDCARFDFTADPLNDLYMPAWEQVIQDWLAAPQTVPNRNAALNGVLGYVRAPTSEAAKLAVWHKVFNPFKLPLDPQATASQPTLAEVADAAMAKILARMYFDDESMRGTVTQAPSFSGLFAQEIYTELEASLTNRDANRGFELRRLCVDFLHATGSEQGYTALMNSKAAIEAQMPSLTGDEKLLTTELLTRIDAATTVFFR